MRKRLTRQNMTRKLRLLSVLFALLLVPIGAWADYELTIQYGTEEGNFHSVSVPESATDVLGDGTITYDVDSHVLTFNGANLTCSYNSSTFIVNGGYWDAEQELTVRLVGSNTITLGNGSSFYDGKGITFATDESNPGSLQIIKESGWDGILFKNSSTEITPICEDYLAYYASTSEIKHAEYYPLWICGIQVTEANAPNVLNFIEPAIVFDASTNTLTLNDLYLSDDLFEDLDFSGPFITNGLENLTISLVSDSRLFGCTYFLAKSGDGEENNTVTFTTDFGNPGSIEAYCSNTSPWYTGHTVNWENGLSCRTEYDGDYGESIYLSSPGFTVAGTLISDGENIVGDNIVLFDSETNTLTLENTEFTVEGEDFIVSCFDELTVFLVGENNLTCYSDNAFSSSIGDATITFTTDADSNGSLTIMAGNLFGDDVTPAYSNVSMKDDGDTHMINSSLGLSVGGVDVTFFNTDDVLGDETAVYDAGTHTLTLNNATIVPDEGEETPGIVYYNEEDLTIALIGDNSVQGAGGCSAISKYYGVETPHLYFAKGDEEQHFSLTLIANSEDDWIDGFETEDTYGDFFVFDDEDDGTFTMTICSSVFGGTGSEDEPFLIKTPEDLKNFADYYNEGRFSNDVHVQLYNTIDCSGLEGFTPIGTPQHPFVGTFDGKGKKIIGLLYDAGSEEDYTGLFFKVGGDGDEPAPGYVSNLTLENCTFENGNMYNGAIAGILNKGTIDNCTVTSCSILSETSQPSCGGIVGGLFGGSITNCTVSGSTITATSVAGSLAGGIVAFAYGSDNGSATVSGCQVTGTATNPTTITGSSNYGGDQGDNPTGGIVGYCGDEYSIVISNNKVSGNTTISSIDYDGNNNYTCAGAIVGDKGNASFSNNYYYYTVTTSTKNGEAEVVERSGYQQRGTGYSSYDEQLEVVTEDYDILTDNGAMLYTKKLTIDMEHVVEGGPDGWYEPLSNYQNGIFYLVPGQETNVMLQSDDNYSITSVSLSYTTTEGGDPTVVNLENDGEGSTFESSFVMPDYEAMLNVTFTAKPSIWIGDVEVDEDGNFPDIETASFDAETNTLTLNGINYGGEITSGLDELIIKVTGTDNQVNKIVSLNPAATLTFEKASADAAASLSLSTAHLIDATAVISGFASVDFGDMYLSSSTPYKYDTANKLLVDATADETEELTSATVTSVVHYPLWIAGTQATAGTITGEEYHSGDYTFNTVSGVTFTPGTENVLSMENAQIDVRCYDEYDHCHPAIISNLDNLTIQLTGGSTINFGGSYGNFIVSSLNSDAVLTFKAVETDASLNTSISSSAYIGTPGNGFSSIVYDNDLFFIAHNTSTQSIKKLDAPGIYISDMLLSLYSYDTVADGMESLALKYSIEYFDGETSPVSDATFTDETELTIDAPCIITAYAELNGKRSATATAKYLAFTEPLTLVYSGESYELTNAALPALVPTVAEGDDVTYEIGETSNGSVISFSEATGKWMVDGVGTAVLYMSLNGGDETPYLILNEVAQLTVNVVSDISTMYIADIADIAYTGSAVTPTIVVKASEEAEASLVAGTDYTVSYKQGETAVAAADLVDLGTYTAVITGIGNYGGTAEIPFNIMRQLDIAFSDNNSWTTYYATESLQVPTGLQAYSVTEITPSQVVAQEVEYIPANTAVLLKVADGANAAGPFMAEAYDGTETGIGTNLLQGTSTDLAVSSITTAPVFVLYRDQFVKTTTGSIPAHRGYLVVDPSTLSEPFSRLSIVIGDETTRISVPAIVSSDDSYYDLQGRRVNRADVKKGLYIRNGKKTYIK